MPVEMDTARKLKSDCNFKCYCALDDIPRREWCIK
ncbi:hypothetical protein LSH36_109g05010, partial [Paralvinella palmiformis]